MFAMPFATWQLRFQEHLAATQPCAQLADWFAEALVPFFHHLRGLGVSQVEAITAPHVESVRYRYEGMAWRPPQASKWEGALFPVSKPPLTFLSPAQKLFAARLFLDFLWRSGVLPHNLAHAVPRLPVRPRRQGLTDMEAEAILLAAGLATTRPQTGLYAALALRNQAMVSLLYRDAVNPADVRAARVSPASLACGALYTRRRGAPARSIPLTPQTAAHVRAWHDRRDQVPHTNPQPALFLTVAGDPVDDTTLRATVREAACEAGLSAAVTPTSLHTSGWARQRAQACSVPEPQRVSIPVR